MLSTGYRHGQFCFAHSLQHFMRINTSLSHRGSRLLSAPVNHVEMQFETAAEVLLASSWACQEKQFGVLSLPDCLHGSRVVHLLMQP